MYVFHKETSKDVAVRGVLSRLYAWFISDVLAFLLNALACWAGGFA